MDIDPEVLGQSTVLDRIFSEARTFNGFLDRPIEDAVLLALHEQFKWGPTTANTNPGRFVFVRSAEAKARLLRCVGEGNVAKVSEAPVTVIVAWDSEFYQLMPKLFPGRDYMSMFKGKDALIEDIGTRSSALQGAYLMLAARALGLDCGPMSGFDMDQLNAEFFPDGKWRSNFLCNIGYGRQDSLFPRNPRPDFDEVCSIL